MSFHGVAPAMPFTRREIRAVNEVTKPIIKELRPFHRKCMERLFMRALSSSEFVTLAAISARTLSWGKIIEIIPLETFKSGMLDEAHIYEHLMGDDDLPVFAGTGLDKGTLRSALNGLASKGLIGRFAVESGGREVFAYMPLSVRSLCYFVGAESEAALSELPSTFRDIDDISLSDLEERFIVKRRTAYIEGE